MKLTQYKISVKGTDIFGLTFLNNIIELANKGAVLDEEHLVSNKWPHHCVMVLETDKDINKLVDFDFTKGISLVDEKDAIKAKYLNEDELKALSWVELRKRVKKDFNLTEGNREELEEEYLRKVKEKTNPSLFKKKEEKQV